MSKSQLPDAVPPSTNQYPSSAQLVALDQLAKQEPSAERSVQAWDLLNQVMGHSDFHAVYDFCLENGLVQSCEVTDPRRQPNRTWRNPKDGTLMAWIPGGPFRVGEKKQNTSCEGFSLAVHPITNAQFAKFLDETNYKPDPNLAFDREADTGYRNGRFLEHWKKGNIPEKLLNHPVVYVSYLDALAYCTWADLTLPGEFLWEKAARGTDGREFPWGDNMHFGSKIAQVSGKSTCDVAEFATVRSPYGCIGMIGNVSEWCQPGNPEQPGLFPPSRPTVKLPTEKRPVFAAVRGSAFNRVERGLMRSRHRRKLSIIRRNHWVGFRPAFLMSCCPAT